MTLLDIPLDPTIENTPASVLIDDRYIHLGTGDDAPLVEVSFHCMPSGRYVIEAEGVELWSGRNCLQAAMEWTDISGEPISLADVAAANCGEALRGGRI